MWAPELELLGLMEDKTLFWGGALSSGVRAGSLEHYVAYTQFYPNSLCEMNSIEIIVYFEVSKMLKAITHYMFNELKNEVRKFS
jgi:hypothetical protein